MDASNSARKPAKSQPEIEHFVSHFDLELIEHAAEKAKGISSLLTGLGHASYGGTEPSCHALLLLSDLARDLNDELRAIYKTIERGQE